MQNVDKTGARAYQIERAPGNKIGQGRSPSVHRIRAKDTNELYAAKFLRIPASLGNPIDESGSLRDEQSLKQIRHPFVLRFVDEFEYFEDNCKYLCTVTQLANGGNLETLISQQKHFTEEEGMRYFAMILLGLSHLHSRQITHGNLRASKILINKLPGRPDTVLIGGLGNNKHLRNCTAIGLMNGLRPPYHMAPE